MAVFGLRFLGTRRKPNFGGPLETTAFRPLGA